MSEKQPIHNYSGNGWEGTNYDSSLSTTEISKKIRSYVKQTYPDCKFSVTSEYYSGGSSIHIYLMEAPFEVATASYTTEWENGNQVHVERPFEGYSQINHHFHNTHLNDEDKFKNNGTILTAKALQLLKDVSGYANSYNYDDSDSMIDYFSTRFYLHMNIGKWDKPFKVVKPKSKKPLNIQETDEINPEDLQAAADYLDRLNIKFSEAVEIGEYKGHPTIKLPCNSKGFTFGISKAKAIIEYLDDIKKFVELNK